MFNWIIGIPLLTLFASAVLAITVIPSTRHEPGRFTLNILLVLITVWTFCSVMFHSIDFPSSLFWIYLIFFWGYSSGVVAVHFSAQFAEQTGKIIGSTIRIFYISIPVITTLIVLRKIVQEARLLPNGAVELKFGPLAPLMWGLAGLAILVAISVLTLTLFSPSRSGKKYVIYTLVGYIVMCLGSLSNVFASAYPIDIATNFVFLCIITYAVVSQHALRPSFRQTWYLSLPVLGVILTLCYIAVLIFYLKWLGITAVTSHLTAAVVTIILGLMTFSPLRTYLLNKLNLYFFPSIYHYQKALSDIAHVDRSLAQWGNSVIKILDILVKTTNADGAVLLIRNIKTKCYEANYAVGYDTASLLHLRFPIDNPLVKTLTERNVAINTEEIGQQGTIKVIIRDKDDSLRKIGAMLCYGIQTHGGLIAIVALTRESQREWSRTEDREFMELACNQISPLIINANLYRESLLEIKERKRMEEKLRESEEHYRELANSISDIFFAFDSDLRYTYWNKASEQLTGVLAKDALGKHLYDIFPKNEQTIVAEKIYLETLKTKLPQHFINEYRIGDKDLVLEISTYPSRDGLSVFVKDITNQRRMDEKLRLAEQNFRGSLDDSPLGVRIVTSDGETVYANRALLDIYGYRDIEELKNTPAEKRYTPESYAEHHVRKGKRQRGEYVPSEYEINIVRKDGEVCQLEVFRKEVLWNDKPQFQVLYHDITKLKKMQEQLIMQDRLASIGQLVSGVAHELNNPLTSVIGFSDLLLQRRLPDDIKADLKIINDEANRTSNIVKNLLTFARKQSQEKQAINIYEILQAVLQLRAHEQRVNNIQVTTRFTPDLPRIHGNISQLQQVFFNIIVNAEFFMLEAHWKGTLTIISENLGNYVRVSFADDGPGISEENMARLFTPFYTTKEVGKGTGLGLSICQGIVSEHGGRIWAESKFGKGATFIVELPVHNSSSVNGGSK